MSLEAARTRMRMHQAYLATMLPESDAASLMGYSLSPIRSPVFQAVTVRDIGMTEVPAPKAVAAAGPSGTYAGSPPDRRALICLTGLDTM